MAFTYVSNPVAVKLTHWGRVTHICVSKLTIIGSDNGLSPDRRQAIVWTNAGLLLIGPLGTNFNEILIEILTFPFKKMRLKVPSAKRRPFCLGINVLNSHWNWSMDEQLHPTKQWMRLLLIHVLISILVLSFVITWWRHQMETFSALLAICAGNSPVPGEFPTQRPVTRSFDVYFDLRPDKRLSKQS